MIRPPPISPLFPYTTLFRSADRRRHALHELSGLGGAGAGFGGPLAEGRQRRGGEARRRRAGVRGRGAHRSEEHTSELQSRRDLVCRLLLEKKNKRSNITILH